MFGICRRKPRTKNEIFNCVNENLTVKQVADICKKINKNLEIIKTNDSVPNKDIRISKKSNLQDLNLYTAKINRRNGS